MHQATLEEGAQPGQLVADAGEHGDQDLVEAGGETGEGQGSDAHELHQDVEARPGGVLEGVAHGVTQDGRGDRLLQDLDLLFRLSCLDGGLEHGVGQLLAVVGQAARVGQGDGQDEAREEDTREDACFEPRIDDPGDEDAADGQGPGLLERAERGVGADLDALVVVGVLGLAPADAMELLDHDLEEICGSLTDLEVGDASELEGEHSTDGQARENVDVAEVHVGDADAGLVHEGQEEGDGREDRGGNGQALAGGGRRVADRVELVADLLGLGVETPHLRTALRRVGDGAVGVDGQVNGEQGQHGSRGHGDPEEPAEPVDHDHADRHEQGDRHRRLHAHGQGGDHVHGDAALALLDQELGVLGVGGGVGLGDRADHRTDEQADDDADEETESGVVLGADVPALGHDDEEQSTDDQGHHAGGAEGVDVQGLVDVVLAGVLVDLDHLEGEDGDHETDTGDGEGQKNRQERIGTRSLEASAHGHGQDHGPDDGSHVGLEQVSAHARGVTHVVARTVGDAASVPDVVLFDAELVSSRVGSHVGSLGEHSAAHAGEESHQAGAKGVADDHVQDQGHVPVGEQGQAEDDDGQAEKAQSVHSLTGNTTSPEGDLEGAGHTLLLSSPGRPVVGQGGDVHGPLAGQSRDEAADEHGHTHEPVALGVEVGADAEDDGHGSGDLGDGPVLLLEEGLSRAADKASDLDLLGVASAALEDLLLLEGGDHEREHADANNGPENCVKHSHSISLY